VSLYSIANFCFLAKKTAPPAMSAIRKRDAEQFKKAGAGKPVV
jgi:hypothetical protein